MKDYIERHLFPAMRTDMSTAMQRCLASPGASKANFTLVADIASNGAITSVAVKPTTDTARCFAKSFSTLQLPPPPRQRASGLPIFIEMELGG